MPIKPFYFTFNLEGQDENKGAFFSEPSSALLINNMHFDEVGAFTSRGIGYSAYVNTLPVANIKSLGLHITSTQTPYMLIQNGTNLYQKNIATGVLSSALNGADVWTNNIQYFQLKDATYIISRDLNPRKWSPAGGYTTASGWPVHDGTNNYEKPKLGITFNNRGVFANFNGFPSHLVISETLKPENYTFTGSATTRAALIEVGTGDGGEIVALNSIYSPDSGVQNLLIFKSNGVWLLTGTNPDNYNITKINTGYSCCGPNSTVQVGKDVYFISNEGIYTIGTSADSGTIQPVLDGSTKIKPTFNTINTETSSNSWAIHLPWRKEVWFAIPSNGSALPNLILVLRYDQQTPIWTVRTNFDARCILFFNSRLFSGQTTGKVQEWFTANSYDGTTFNWEYKYDFFDFKQLMHNKRLRELFLYLDTAVTGSATTNETWQFDTGSKTWTTNPTITVALNSAYDTATYGASAYSDPSINFYKHKIPVRGNGQRLQLTVKSDTSLPCVFFGFSGSVQFGGLSRNHN